MPGDTSLESLLEKIATGTPQVARIAARDLMRGPALTMESEALDHARSVMVRRARDTLGAEGCAKLLETLLDILAEWPDTEALPLVRAQIASLRDDPSALPSAVRAARLAHDEIERRLLERARGEEDA